MCRGVTLTNNAPLIYRNNPYSFKGPTVDCCLLDRSRIITSSGLVRADHLSKRPATTTEGISNYHTAFLNGRCRFIQLGEHTVLPFDPAMAAVSGSPFAAFIGQTRFETTAEQVAWLVREATGVELAFVAAHQIGCFVAHCWSAADLEAVLSLHGRVLFDASGAWLACDKGEEEALVAAVAASSAAGSVFQKRRLPRHRMLVEPFTCGIRRSHSRGVQNIQTLLEKAAVSR